jgi:hypothetical protein
VTSWNCVLWILIVWGYVWRILKACGSHHTKIYGLIHEPTTHENSTTMSLYGYDLTKYVVESSLSIPIDGAD